MKNPDLIAFYFPQFHSIPENDTWWGKGFQDWNLVKNTRPLYKGHNQPCIPIDNEFYDPCERDTLIKQTQLAKEYGINGFMLYHYWFDGKLLLEKPLEVLLNNKDIDIQFCLCWANETWTRSWIGKPEEVLIEQRHTENHEIWIRHFNYLLPFLKDKRAIKKDGKPVFVVYQPHLIKKTKEMFALWNKLAVENGLQGIYFIAIKNHKYVTDVSFLSYYDGLLKFQPREAYTSDRYVVKSFYDKMQFLRVLPESLIRYFRKIRYKISDYVLIDSEKLWENILEQAYKPDCPQFNLDLYESGFFKWDNTPRYGKKARIYSEVSKKNKIRYLTLLKSKAIENNSSMIFWNAWNEWSEGAYLEPDTFNGYENLEVMKEVMKQDF